MLIIQILRFCEKIIRFDEKLREIWSGKRLKNNYAYRFYIDFHSFTYISLKPRFLNLSKHRLACKLLIYVQVLQKKIMKIEKVLWAVRTKSKSPNKGGILTPLYLANRKSQTTFVYGKRFAIIDIAQPMVSRNLYLYQKPFKNGPIVLRQYVPKVGFYTQYV